MDGMNIIRKPYTDETIKEEMSLCNSKTARQGIALNEEEMKSLILGRNESLREMRRIEFGSGPLLELVETFASSPYVRQENYVETMAALQDYFYLFKEETGEELGDSDLIEAMREVFDSKAQGALEYFDGLTSDQLFDIANARRNDANENWSDSEAYEEEADKSDESEVMRDEIDRIYEAGRHDRPDNEFADNFYNPYNELYQSGFDNNSRIGGSSL